MHSHIQDWRPSRLAIGATIIALAAAVLVWQAPEAEAAQTPAAFESCLLSEINASRAAAGVGSLAMATDLTGGVRAWSQWMSNNEFRHMTTAERNPILPPGTVSYGENIAAWGGTGDIHCSLIHNALMNSDGHRANILRDKYTFVAIGAYSDGSSWWVTQVFFKNTSYTPSGGPPPPPPVCDGKFCDDDGSQFESDIEKIAAAGITLGCNPPNNNKFCPTQAVTRGAMAAFLSRALNLKTGNQAGNSIDFIDDNGSVFESDIEKLAAAGITLGCNPPANNRFCPGSVVTRETMAAFLSRALNLKAGKSIDFIDDNNSIFESDIEKLAAAGITLGCNPPANNRFCPTAPVTRQTMAAFLARALNL